MVTVVATLEVPVMLATLVKTMVGVIAAMVRAVVVNSSTMLEELLPARTRPTSSSQEWINLATLAPETSTILLRTN